MIDDKLIGLIGYVLMADSRKKIMEFLLGKYSTLSGISRKCNISIQLSNSALKALEEKGLVTCIDNSHKRYKIYYLTDIGVKVSENLEEYSKIIILE